MPWWKGPTLLDAIERHAPMGILLKPAYEIPSNFSSEFFSPCLNREISSGEPFRMTTCYIPKIMGTGILNLKILRLFSRKVLGP